MTAVSFGPRRAVLAFFLLMALALIPIASVEMPPLFDYPNHLARMAILADDGQDEWLGKYYAIRWALLPNLAMDAIVPILSRFMPLMIAGRVFLAGVFILLAGGTMLLYRTAWKEWSWWSCLGFLLLYNRILLWGFLNYLFGLGLALCAAALWLSLSGRPWLRLLVVAPLVLLVFFSHLAAFGVLGLLLGGSDIAPAWAELCQKSWGRLMSRVAVLIGCFIVPAMIFVLWQPHAAGSPGYGHFWRKADLIFSVFDNYHRGFDVVCFGLFLALLIAGASRGQIHPRLGGAAALLGFAYLTIPATLFTGAGADHRLPLAIFATLIPAIRPKPIPLHWSYGLAALFGAIFIARIMSIEQVWLAADKNYHLDLGILATLPEGSRVAVASSESAVRVTPLPEVHFPTMAIAFEHALVPTLFTYEAQQPVAFHSPYDQIAGASQPGLLWKALINRGAAPLDRANRLAAYDYVVLVNDRPFIMAPMNCLSQVGATATFQLYRIAHHAQNCP